MSVIRRDRGQGRAPNTDDIPTEHQNGFVARVMADASGDTRAIPEVEILRVAMAFAPVVKHALIQRLQGAKIANNP